MSKPELCPITKTMRPITHVIKEMTKYLQTKSWQSVDAALQLHGIFADKNTLYCQTRGYWKYSHLGTSTSIH